MDFTSLYSCASSSSGSILSPCSSYLLVANPGFLVLRDAVSFQVLQSWKTAASTTTSSSSSSKSAGSMPSLSQLAFSSDSQYCLAVDAPAQTAYVYSVSEDRPVATIKAGQEGMQGARWLENGVTGQRYVAVWARHAVGSPFVCMLSLPKLNERLIALGSSASPSGISRRGASTTYSRPSVVPPPVRLTIMAIGHTLPLSKAHRLGPLSHASTQAGQSTQSPATIWPSSSDTGAKTI